ncbi:P-II family nitrogen regulator [Clostridium oryzae]|uniref:Nitrogen regulatory protein P-II n=1 Tax=Clostridium oryzae TaxID=1450648 RepID=A0A1V4IJD6_9CLOT|nr:P-II family nitrogen regulator [Clostridium oryzae]OPJ60118.1 nitrogen regulatory protein P-II [Clostridium oryzae]
MKKLEIVLRPEKLEELKEAFNEIGVSGMSVSTVMGYGNQKGATEIYRGTQITATLLHKLKVETIVKDELVDKTIEKIREKISTGKIGDGKIFIYNVEDAVRVRTGETGEKAL